MASGEGDKDDVNLAVLESGAGNKVARFFAELKPGDYQQSLPDRFTDAEIKEILSGLKSSFISKHKVNEQDFPVHIVFFLIRAASVSTSTKAVRSFSYKYTISSVTYEISDQWIFGEVNSICSSKTFSKQNNVKAFCSTLEDAYLAVSQHNPRLISPRVAARKGVPSGFEYLAADFISCGSSLLRDHERAVAVAAQRNSIENSRSNGASGQIVSLFDFGRF